MRKTLLNLCMVTLLSVVSTYAWALSQVNGVYQIGSAADLKAFADLVNNGTAPGASAVLTADIDYRTYTTGFIGLNENGKKYTGTFDGQGHTVTTNIQNSGKWTGLFGTVDGATIRNIIVNGSVESSQSGIGGLGGLSWGATKIENVVVISDVKVYPAINGNCTCGGIFGDMEGTAARLTNCAFYGSINVGSEGTYVGGLVGYTGGVSITNSLVAVSSVISKYRPRFCGSGGTTLVNSYVSTDTDGNGFTAEQISSGEVCYILNGNQNGGTNWYQTIGTDAKPVPFATSKRVYKKSASEYVNFDVVEGKLQIGNATDLYNFSAVVNAGGTTLNAELTADIDYTASEYQKGFIGTTSKQYSGTFDGQGHTITTNIENDALWTGLFGTVNGATIRNIIVDGNVKSSQKGIGGLGGLSYGSTTVQNVVVKSTVKFTGTGDSTCGGLFGDMEGAFTVTNCAFLGTINVGSGTNVGGLVSWTGSGSFSNCLVAPVEITAGSQKDFVHGGAGTCSNCYKVAHNDARLASGELCYLLNGSTNDGTNWKQTIGTNAYPIPFSTSQTVHQASTSCYTNLPVSGGIVQVGTPANLQKFAAEVNAGNTSMDVVVTANIDYSTYTQGFIGTTSNKYAGTFDGQMHTVTLGLMGDAAIRGLFAFINGATIRNLVVDGSISSSYKNIGGLGGQVNGSSTVQNIVVNTSINYTGSGTDSSCGGFFPYVDNGSTLNFNNCAFYGSIKVGTATFNAGLVAWNSGTINATNCIVAPAELETGSGIGAFDDYARYNPPTTTNCYKVDATDARLASGELCYLLNGDQSEIGWYQAIGTDANPVPFNTKPNVYQIAVSSVGYASFVPKANILALPTGVKAYAGQDHGSYLHLEQVTELPADAAVIVKADEGNYYCNSTDETRSLGTSNDLTFSNTDLTATGTQYCLAKKSDVVGFYKVNAGVTIPARKVYLDLSGSSVREFLTFVFDEDDATGINSPLLTSPEEEGQVYNLAGQRISKLQKGINIINGKKVLK